MKLLYILALPLLVACGGGSKPVAEQTDTAASSPEFCEDSAYAYVAAQCSYGPRTMNSAAHDSCGNWIAQKFASYGAKIYDQYAPGRLWDGTAINMRNIIASFNPDAETRIFISGHWDSRPWADNDDDEANHNTAIDGANDGGSGIGVMIEIARQLYTDMQQNGDSALLKLNPGLGIDFICWDAEDSGSHGEGTSGTWCLGSQYWSGTHHVEGYKARYGINLDMVGNDKTVFRKEGVSMYYAPTVVDRIWSTARRLGYSNYFTNDACGEMIDDHVQVNRSGIPCVDIIGIDAEQEGFPRTWHTIDDNLSHISKQTLKAVGQTMMEVIWTEK